MATKNKNAKPPPRPDVEIVFRKVTATGDKPRERE